jgi:hypothetical protein
MSQQDAYEGSHENDSNENESNENESNENESNENESTDDESSYDYDEFSEEEENPLPQWNLPNWRGNATECLATACPCIKQVVEDGSIRGCVECDDYWDMPSLVGDAEEIQSR